MGFFDSKDHRPPSSRIEVGESVEGVLTHLGMDRNMKGEMALVYAIDGGKPTFAAMTLWRTLAEARVDAGDRIRITRGPDEDRGAPSPAKTWTVERLTGAPTGHTPAVPPWNPPTGAAPQQVPAW